MTIARNARERHLVCAIAALADEDFDVIDRLVFAMLRRENEARAALVLAGLTEGRAGVPPTHPSVRPSVAFLSPPRPGVESRDADPSNRRENSLVNDGPQPLRSETVGGVSPSSVEYPSAHELDERIGLLELRDE